MCNLLIVDDEKTTRDSLRDLIPWDELGIAAVAVARNGNEALETAHGMQPDILLSDIRMPKMDGLELARHIRDLFPDCKIIFLSGYADKEYLKSAIHLKAVSYIEKPINPAEIVPIIRETVAACKEERQRKSALARLKSTVQVSQPLVRQEITLELIKGDTDVATLSEKYGNLPYQIFTSRLSGATVAYLTLRWHGHPDAQDMKHDQQSLLQLFSDDTLGDPSGFTAGFDPQGNIIFIAAVHTGYTADPGSQPLWQQLLAKINEQSRGAYRCAIGVGSPAASLDQIPASYRAAVQAASCQFYEGCERIYFCGASHAAHPLELDRLLFATFKENLQKNELATAQSLIRDLTRKIRSAHHPDTNRVKNVYFHLLLLIFEVAWERGLIDPFSPAEENYIWREVEEKKSLEELSDYVISCVQSIYIRVDTTEALNRKINEIRRYIFENYGHNDLSVQSIAAHVYLSPTYLCALFKKATGKTLNEFITGIRMDKARELLADRSLKLYEIAGRVGFTDVNYFSTLFKRFAGCTPSEFREKVRR